MLRNQIRLQQNTPDYHDPANWPPSGSPEGADAIISFGGSGIPTVNIKNGTDTIGGWVFSPGAAVILSTYK